MNISFKGINTKPKTQISISGLEKFDPKRPYGFSIFKNFIFFIDVSKGEVVVIDKETTFVLKRVFVNQHISGLNIDSENGLVFVTSYKKIFKISIDNLINEKNPFFLEFTQLELEQYDFFNGVIAINTTDKELYFVVKNIKTKKCRIIYYYTETCFNDNLFLNEESITTVCGYHLQKYRVLEPCIIDNKIPFANIHSIHYLEKEKILVAFNSNNAVAFILTHSGIYIKTLHGFDKRILNVVYDKTNSTFISTHLDNTKMTIYHYDNQTILFSKSIELQEINKSRQIPIAFDECTKEVLVYDGDRTFFVFEYEKDLIFSSSEYFLTIQDSPFLFSPDPLDHGSDFQTSYNLAHLSFIDSETTTVSSSNSIDLSEVLNSVIPLTEIRPEVSYLNISYSSPNRAKHAKRTFSDINKKSSIEPLVCKKLRIPVVDEDSDINTSFTTFLKLANPEFFLADYSSFDDSWKTKDVLFPKPEHCEWETTPFKSDILSISEINQLID